MPLRPLEVRGPQCPCPLEVAHSLPAQWSHQTPDMGPCGPCCLFTSSGSGFQTSKEVKSEPLDRPEPMRQYFQAQPLQGHRTGTHWHSGWDGCCKGGLVNCGMTSIPGPASCMPAASPEIVGDKSALPCAVGMLRPSMTLPRIAAMESQVQIPILG